jgi:hypothetical protein
MVLLRDQGNFVFHGTKLTAVQLRLTYFVAILLS